jgi:cytoskeleton protein RodZ
MENLASLLRQTRENKRLTLKDVETATRIPAVYLRVLEGGEGLMSDQVYLMPFLRTYAKFLGMDIDAVVTQFISELQRTDSRPLASSQRRVTAAAAPSVPSSLSFWALPLLLSLGILLVGSFLWQNGLSGVETLWPTFTTKSASPPEQEKTTSIESSPEVSFATDLPTEQPARPSESTAPIAVVPSSTALVPSTPERTSGTAQTAASVPAQTESATVAAAAPLIDGTGHRLNIQASSPSWVRIVVDDQSPKEMILKAGEAREWSAQQGFTLSFGNAGGVTLHLDGQPLPPLGKSGQVVRNIRLPADTAVPPMTTTLQ